MIRRSGAGRLHDRAEEIEEDASLYQQYTGTVQTIIAQIRGDLAAEITARQNAVSAEDTRQISFFHSTFFR